MPINTHPFNSEDVMAYLDGELSAETAAEMTTHLTQCRLCQDVAADLQIVSRQLSGWTVEPIGEGIPQNLVKGLDEKAAEKKPTKRNTWQFLAQHPWRIVTAIAAVFVVALFLPVQSQRRNIAEKRSPELATMEMAPPPGQSASTLRPTDSTGVSFFSPPPIPPTTQSLTPLVVRTAELSVTARNFDTVRTDVDRILLQLGGHIAQLNLASPTGESRSLNATLRIPSSRLDAGLAELRKLGRVNGESLRGDEVTQQSVDLEARLSNLRRTEERLAQILATRTGKLSDVLDVEQKLSEVRGQIEQAEAEQKSLQNRITFANVQLTVSEDYRAPLATTTEPTATTRISNAAVRGLHNAFNGLVGLLLIILRAGPSLLIFGALLGLPGYFLWKHLRHR